MIGLCNDCYTSGIEVTIDTYTSEAICSKCDMKREKKRSPEPFCTCKACPVHDIKKPEPVETIEKIIDEVVEG